jgi:hypothetical protein
LISHRFINKLSLPEGNFNQIPPDIQPFPGEVTKSEMTLANPENDHPQSPAATVEGSAFPRRSCREDRRSARTVRACAELAELHLAAQTIVGAKNTVGEFRSADKSVAGTA